MIITTTPNIEGKQIVEYKQVVFGEVIAGANFMRDFFAGITDVIGGRSSVYERRISRARQDALKELRGSTIKEMIESEMTLYFGYGKSE